MSVLTGRRFERPASFDAWHRRYRSSPAGRSLDRIGLPAMLMLGVVFGIGQARGLTQKPLDFVLYWKATDFSDLYPADWLSHEYAYVYPPPFAQILAPIHVLPFDVAAVIWSVICFGSMWYVARAWSLPLVALGLVGSALDLPRFTTVFLEYALLGNVQWPMAAGIVLALRYPAAWAIPTLTKIGPGIGMLWLVFRREWRGLRTAVLVTLAIAAVSFVLAPSAWIEFVNFSVENYGKPGVVPIVGPPFPVRLVMAAIIIWIGARTNQEWLVYIATGIAIPALYAWSFLPVWIAAARNFGVDAGQTSRVASATPTPVPATPATPATPANPG